MVEALFLRALIDRIEAKIGPVSVRDIGYDVDKGPDPEKLAVGWYRLAFAVVMARDALECGDERRITREAARCQSLEREAETIAARVEARRQRERGGAMRGAQQRAAAEADWRPYVEQYRSLLAGGMPYLRARQKVLEQRMQKNGEPWPSAPTINRRLPKPEKKSG